MKAYLLFSVAALAEIAGCFAFWAWWRLDKPVWWLVPGLMSLAVFAAALALVPSEAAGRTYAAYGGIYIVASILWLWLVEGRLAGTFPAALYASPEPRSSCSDPGPEPSLTACEGGAMTIACVDAMR